ncbi:Flp pilus assembly protein CpaB [Vibrio sp. SCSIO 43136]|uniref:Flp pilus assembly protein CpaB n=1 Tax=Vibrio sp. SCSIO 43136 TaxID=2819101 RepID=UPI0020756E8B|nr:Flp pilus assembly protein CpaB [Vibrio sp. SCSIO 43136]USD64739.1 Flp pilus assembly protein CpaB [Vibrio sp. SCSIO 43136]
MSLRVLIPTALIATGAALYGLSGNYLGKPKETEVVQAPPKEIPKVSVQILASDITKGHIITSEDLVTIDVDEPEAIKSGYNPETPFEIHKGMAAKKSLNKDHWVSRRDFVLPQDDGYVEAVITPGMVPYPLVVQPESIVGGVISAGHLIDVVALSSIQQNLANDTEVGSYRSVSISPVIIAAKVLKIESAGDDADVKSVSSTATLILELTRKQVATISIAKTIAQLEVHKSIGKDQADQLQADSGDVLPTYRAIKEFRASKLTIQ